MTQRFQVDLGGIITLLSDHIYSGPHVFVRELMQNGVDAILARRLAEGGAPTDGQRSIRFRLISGGADGAPAQLVVQDEGIGLNEAEIHAFLATIGQSAKRGVIGERNDYIGQFGVGLLSAFVVSDEIEVLTRKLGSGDEAGLRFVGRRDGTYEVASVAEPLPVGTTVRLRPRRGSEGWFEAKRLLELAQHFGRLLPYHVVFEHEGVETAVSGGTPPWLGAAASTSSLAREVAAFGRDLFEQDFADFIPLRSDSGDIDGIAFVRPRAISVSSLQSHRVYIKGMLVSERCDNLLPPWAGFLHGVVNAHGLRPTASREQLYEDETLATARDALGDCVKRWLHTIATAQDGRLARLMAVHELSLRSYALDDDVFFTLIIDHFQFETTQGFKTFGELRRMSGQIRYARTVPEFQQLAPIARAEGMMVVNAGHVFDVDLLSRAESLLDGLEVRRMVASELRAELEDLTLDERRAAGSFLEAAAEALEPLGCDVEIRHFSPTALPALYVDEDDTGFARSLNRAREQANPLWGAALEDLLQANPEPLRASLVFNFRNPLVRRLVRVLDAELLSLNVRLVYVQTLLMAHRPLSTREAAILNDGLIQLIERSLVDAAEVLQ